LLFLLQSSDVVKAGVHVGFPAVIKPVSGAASIGVIRVNDQEELQAAYERLVRVSSTSTEIFLHRLGCCICLYTCGCIHV
jgi:biotin carboxylase